MQEDLAGRPGLPAEELAELLSGTPYRAVEFLGRGGTGEVYVVEHVELGRRFALKRIHARHVAASAGLVERMRREAQTLGRLQHPNIVEIIHYWTTSQGLPCLVLQLLRGRTLADELQEKRLLSVEHAVTIAGQVLRGLGAAHGLGIVHRDMKPENVFLHRTPGFETVVKILDFGLARILQEMSPAPPARGDVRTATGALVGSPRYYSPEAFRREPVDHRADLYGVGLILYQMLTGQGAYDYDADFAAAPSTLAEVPSELDAVVLRSIRKDKQERFQSAEEFLSALEAAQPRSSAAPPAWRPAPGWTRNPI
jgi:eukaryotic-like serine/threonine-protein kinase